jgi:probable phosphoglycerate mutase
MRHHHHLQQTHAGLSVVDFAAPTLGTGHLHLLNLTTPTGEQLPKLKAGKQGLRLLLLPCQSDILPDAALANLVKEHPIAACIVEDHPDCYPGQRSLLTHHPDTMILAVQQTDFLHQWQRSLRQSLVQMSPTELMTIAAVCHHAHAESFLQAVIGRPLPLLPNALTVLHYPGVGQHPILQTLNSRPIPGA